MNTKQCTVERIPDPPPPDHCVLQKIKEKEKAGIIVCPRPPVIQPPPPPDCFALCIERVKNPQLPPRREEAFVCTIEPDKPGTDRCDAILEQTTASADLPWPGCPPPVLPPPPPLLDPCEEQDKRARIAECKERMKQIIGHYLNTSEKEHQ
ncbi:hypothetical protein K1T71_013235 [Dendrolimus kikuchii]|uniref:Uncharacterized protein n=1 Tax=Dendrolimus kikuchii TaxID=765133 RepID=A0ACC1CHS4_9NEOP|nr:hypothetical protein K1T71_013235 [Dendrolimus kikuchii]